MVDATTREQAVEQHADERDVVRAMTFGQGPAMTWRGGVWIGDGKAASVAQPREPRIALHESAAALGAVQRDDERDPASPDPARHADERRPEALAGDGDGHRKRLAARAAGGSRIQRDACGGAGGGPGAADALRAGPSESEESDEREAEHGDGGSAQDGASEHARQARDARMTGAVGETSPARRACAG